MTFSNVPLRELVSPWRDEVPVDPDGVYRLAGVLNRGRGLFDKGVIGGDETKYSRLYRLHSGQLVYSKLFGWEGAIALVSDEHADAFVSSEFPTYRLDELRVLPDYLAHVLAWEGFVSQMSDATTGLGQRRQRVNPDRFLNLDVPLCPMDQQQRIASRLNRLHLQVAPTVEQAAAAMDGVLDRLDWSQDVASVLELDIEEIAVDPERSYRLMGVYGHGRGAIDRGPMLGSSTAYTTMNRVAGGQVVFSRLKAFEGAVTVVPSQLDGAVVSKEFPSFTIRENVVSDFVDAVLRSRRFHKAMGGASVGIGARRERLSADAFLALEFPNAGRGTQAQIGSCHAARRRAERLVGQRSELLAALLPAARNEVFGPAPG